jgi:hypothetical protein
MNNVEAADIYREVLHIKKDVESVKHQTSWLLRGQADAVAGHWEKMFGIVPGTKRRYNWMKVYLETDGRRSVSQVAAAAGVHEPDAGKWLAKMERDQLVGLLPQKKNDKIYEKSPVDFALGISAKLRAELEKKQKGVSSKDE